MAAGDDAMVRSGEERFETARIVSPEQEHDASGQVPNPSEHGFGEGFPTFAAMGRRGSGANGEDGVEEEDAGPGP